MKRHFRKIFMLLIPVILFLSIGTSHAFLYINDPNYEKNLYKIYNELFGQNLSSSDDLYINHGGVSDDMDDWWEIVGDYGIVKITISYAGYGQELGIQDSDGNYTPVVQNIPATGSISREFEVDRDFAFVEKATSGTTVYSWYSADVLNPIQDSMDHFKAINVTDLYNEKYNTNVDRAWLIAFEDLQKGISDSDYNDLVALVADVQPTTAVTLSSFNAVPGNMAVTLSWSTGDETDNIGFNIYRSESEDGEYTKLNSSLIYSEAEAGMGASYTFVDKDVQNRTKYYYTIEDIDVNGTTAIHGPIVVTPRLLYGLVK